MGKDQLEDEHKEDGPQNAALYCFANAGRVLLVLSRIIAEN